MFSQRRKETHQTDLKSFSALRAVSLVTLNFHRIKSVFNSYSNVEHIIHLSRVEELARSRGPESLIDIR